MNRDPVPVNQAIEPVSGDVGLDRQAGRRGQFEVAMHLPKGVDRPRPAMGEIVVAPWLALRPVAEIVGSDHGEGAAQADQRAEIDEGVLQPQGTGKALVDQAPMHADRMAQQQDRGGLDDEQENRDRIGIAHYGRGRAGIHGHKEQGFDRRPYDAARDGVGGLHLVDAAHVFERRTHGRTSVMPPLILTGRPTLITFS